MTLPRDTIWERYLKPIAKLVIDDDKLRQSYKNIDWQQEIDRIRQPELKYPNYYLSKNFHGVESGYLNPEAAISYDAVTQYVLLPNETWIRQSVIDAIGGVPRRILDLGCGTGSTTVLLKQAFPQAEVIGLDLSPYMLVAARLKAEQLGLDIDWQHGDARATGWQSASFDLVTASLLFHEMPPTVSRSVLQEGFRLTKPGGQTIVLDGNQTTLRHSDWLTNIFEEPYIKAYADGSVETWMTSAGFAAVKTEHLWWVHQITRGIKPIPSQSTRANPIAEDSIDSPDIPAVAF